MSQHEKEESTITSNNEHVSSVTCLSQESQDDAVAQLVLLEAELESKLVRLGNEGGSTQDGDDIVNLDRSRGAVAQSLPLLEQGILAKGIVSTRTEATNGDFGGKTTVEEPNKDSENLEAGLCFEGDVAFNDDDNPPLPAALSNTLVDNERRVVPGAVWLGGGNPQGLPPSSLDTATILEARAVEEQPAQHVLVEASEVDESKARRRKMFGVGILAVLILALVAMSAMLALERASSNSAPDAAASNTMNTDEEKIPEDTNGNNSTSDNATGYPWIQRGELLQGYGATYSAGQCLDLSNDGTVMAVGGPNSNSSNFEYAGHIAVLRWDTSTLRWRQQGQLFLGGSFLSQLGNKGSAKLSFSGRRIALSESGYAFQTGRVRVFEWQEGDRNDENDQLQGIWTQLGNDFLGEDPYSLTGIRIALSSSGSVLAIGAAAMNERFNESSPRWAWPGRVRVFRWDEISKEWKQIGQDLRGKTDNDNVGLGGLSLSGDGATVALGAIGWGRAETLGAPGQVRVYTWNDSSSDWQQVGGSIAGKRADIALGAEVLLSKDGRSLAIMTAPIVGSVDVLVYELLSRNRENFSSANSTELAEWRQIGHDIKVRAASRDIPTMAISFSSDRKRLAVSAINQTHTYEWEPQNQTWRLLGAPIMMKGEYKIVQTVLSGNGNVLAHASSSLQFDSAVSETSTSGDILVYELST